MTSEIILLVLVVTAAILPFLRLWRRHKAAALLVPLLLLAVLVPLASVWGDRLAAREQIEAYVDATTPLVHEEDGHVGSDSCRSCHPGEHASWHATYHRTMTTRAGPDTVKGDFSNRSVTDRGRLYRMQRRGDEFWVELIDPDWDWFEMNGQRIPPPEGSSPPRSWRKVVMVTGSHDTQVYWVPGRHGDRRLNFFPLVWKIETRKWIPLADAFLKYPESVEHLTLWNRTCSQCHATNTRVRPSDGSRSNVVKMDTAVAELGIACEACHGPGREHVEAHRDPLYRYRRHLGRDGENDPTIVNPADLDHERSSHVCAQCHGMAFLKTPEDQRDTQGTPYRPGDDIEDTRIFQDPADPGQRKAFIHVQKSDPVFLINHFWKDGMVRVSGRDFSSMRKSACYTKGELSCLSCHSMHDSDPADMLIRESSTDEVCASCHQEIAADVGAHSHHAPDSSGSSCINCHMPRVTYGLLKGIRNHQIASPSIREHVDYGRPDACTLCHLDRSLEWTAKALTEWYGHEAVDLPADRRRLSAALRMAVQGDAGQRALIANSMGFAEHRAVAGENWMVPILAGLLDDPYGAVRYIAERSLRRLEGYADFEYDMLDDAATRQEAIRRVMKIWERRRPAGAARGPSLLQRPDGSFDWAALKRLLENRDDTKLALGE